MGARRGGGPEPRKSGARRVGGRRVGGPKGGGPEGWGPEGWGAQNFALFLLSPTGNFILSSLSPWEFSRGILVVFLKRRHAQMCAFGVLWLSCEAPAARSGGAAGVPHDSPRAQTCTFERPGLQITTKIQREDLPEREEREKFPAGERKKKRNFGAVQGKGGPSAIDSGQFRLRPAFFFFEFGQFRLRPIFGC